MSNVSGTELSKAVCLTMLMKAEIANPNAGWGEGDITVMKKVTLTTGERHPYISGQALRRYLRDTLVEQGIVSPSEFSPQRVQADEKAPIITEGKPARYFDDDIFGFMHAVRGETRRRESPLRVSAAFGLFPYQGDRDLGTKSKVEATGDAEAGGAMFETEITHNVFRSTWLLELDRVGRGKQYETADGEDELRELGAEVEEVEISSGRKGFVFGLPMERRRERAAWLLQALKYYRGGARCARLLLDLVPQLVIYLRLTKKVPVLLNDVAITPVDDKPLRYRLLEAPVREVLSDYGADIQACIVGVRAGFLDAEAPLREVFGVEPRSIGAAVDAMVADIMGRSVLF